jgi:hypothetical protein
MTHSDQLITPEVWGPHGWKFIHYVTLSYPENPTSTQKEKYKAFLILLKDVLPCSLCANHYEENLHNQPLTDEVLSSREKLIKWGIDIHNIVNEMKDKPIIKYDDAIKIIDTNIECKQKIENFVNDYDTEDIPHIVDKVDNTPYFIENFKDTQKAKKSSYNLDNIYIVYGLLGLLVSLIFIAVIYKKK